MTQYARILVAFLLLGALTNIAVSWACVWFTRKTQWVEVPPPPVKRADGWLWKPPAGWPERAQEPESMRRPGVTLVRVVHWQPRRTAHQMHSIRSGWPWNAMESRWESPSQQAPVESSYDFGIQVVSGSRFGYGVSLPLRPIPRPFVLNAIAYSMLGGVPWYLMRVVKRRVRATRGHCTSCGYSVIGLERCPECGAPAASRSSRRQHA